MDLRVRVNSLGSRMLVGKTSAAPPKHQEPVPGRIREHVRSARPSIPRVLMVMRGMASEGGGSTSGDPMVQAVEYRHISPGRCEEMR
jgi:hypothetical protein